MFSLINNLVLPPQREAPSQLPSLSLGLAVAANTDGAGPGPPPPVAVASSEPKPGMWTHLIDELRLQRFYDSFSSLLSLRASSPTSLPSLPSSLPSVAAAAATTFPAPVQTPHPTPTSIASLSIHDRVRNSLATLSAPLAPLPLPVRAPYIVDSSLIRERLMQPLLPEELARITAAKLETSPDVILSSLKNCDLKRSDLALLEDGEWFNDALVNLYGMMLRTLGETCFAEGRPGALGWTFSSFFYTRLIQHATRYDYPGVQRWTKTVDVFAYERLIFPINRSNTHWALAVIDTRKLTVTYYDSLRGSGADVCSTLIRWINDEHLAKKKSPLPDVYKEAPAPNGLARQKNGFDCGAFICTFMTFLLFDVQPVETMFTQKDIGLWRRKIAAACLAKEIVDVTR